VFQELDNSLDRSIQVPPGWQPLNNVDTPLAGKFAHQLFPAVITGPIASSAYPFSEIEWNTADSRWEIVSGGRSGATAREFEGCATVAIDSIVLMAELVQDDASIGYRFMARGPCTTYQCCFGGVGPVPPGGGGGVPIWVPVRRCGDDTQLGSYVQWSNINALGRYFLLNEECAYVDPFDAAAIAQTAAPGTELTAHDGAITDCTDALCAGPVCTSPVGSSSYQIDNFTAGSFFDISGCSGSGSAQTEWPGTFPFREGDCSWLEDEVGGAFQIQTFLFAIGRMDWNVSQWEIQLDLSGSSVWIGKKTYGATPAGRYTRTGGCSATPATIDIITPWPFQ